MARAPLAGYGSRMPAPGAPGPRPRGRSLRRAFGRLLLLASLLPALIFGAFMVANQHNDEQRRLKESLSASAVVTADAVDQVLEGKLSSLALLADVRSASPPDWPSDLAALRARHPELVTALATDAEGRIVAVVPRERLPEGPLGGVADRDYFQTPRRTLAPHISNAFRGRSLGNDPLVAISAPVVRDGAFAGVVEGSIRVDSLLHEGGKAFTERGYAIALLDRDGKVILATPGLGLEFLEDVDLDARFGPVTGRRPAMALPHALEGGEPALVARAPMRSGWTLVLAASESRLMSGVATRGWMLFGVLLLVTSGVLLASWWQLRQLAGGMRGLLDAMAGLGPGERLPDESRARMPRELAPVADAIDALARRLGEANAGLEEALARERGLAASLQDVVATREQEVAARTEELREAVEELDRVSRTDPLTGALNVRGLEDWMETAWPALRANAACLGLLAMDVDHFKEFNDAYGHPAGDAALKRLVGAVRGALRGPDDEIVRMGGEEFLVLLPGADARTTREVGERTRRAIEAAGIPHEAAAGGVLTASFGMAVADPGRDGDIHRARGDADRALYQAKHDGRNRLHG
ncbi:hypothetical protein GCM10028862_07400 [Luteimonas pelagia]